MKRLNDYSLETPAIAPAVTSGALTGIAIDATGYSRARFKFHFGANTSTAALSAGAAVWGASTSGATYAQIAATSLAAVSSGVLGSKVMIIDTNVPTATPWLKISGAVITLGTIGVSATAQLYSNFGNPPTHTEQQIVVVG